MRIGITLWKRLHNFVKLSVNEDNGDKWLFYPHPLWKTFEGKIGL